MIANKQQIEQVLVNLIKNAADAMDTDSNGSLLVRAHQGAISTETGHIDPTKTDMISIAVEDRGPGIEKGAMAKLFDPFFTTKEVGKGTGLGLSISRGIVEEHGGKIDCANREGGGARFVVALPVCRESAAAAPAEKEGTKHGTNR
ncbi:MAG: hypothetical protein GF344_13690 [Chitinivibrionales bacterium]|nr:hypothetical protein [Chitinivibrionales bacterium]MBD3357781.1 hypothetical protein [Chitinivibrionales bacterium]